MLIEMVVFGETETN